jgi:hypothetical protein
MFFKILSLLTLVCFSGGTATKECRKDPSVIELQLRTINIPALNGYKEISIDFSGLSFVHGPCGRCVKFGIDGNSLSVKVNGQSLNVNGMANSLQQLEKLSVALSDKRNFNTAYDIVAEARAHLPCCELECEWTYETSDLLDLVRAYLELNVEGDKGYRFSNNFMAGPRFYSSFVKYGGAFVDPKVLYVAKMYCDMQREYNEHGRVDPEVYSYLYGPVIMNVHADADSGCLPSGYCLPWAIARASADESTQRAVLACCPHLFLCNPNQSSEWPFERVE